MPIGRDGGPSMEARFLERAAGGEGGEAGIEAADAAFEGNISSPVSVGAENIDTQIESVTSGGAATDKQTNNNTNTSAQGDTAQTTTEGDTPEGPAGESRPIVINTRPGDAQEGNTAGALVLGALVAGLFAVLLG